MAGFGHFLFAIKILKVPPFPLKFFAGHTNACASSGEFLSARVSTEQAQLLAHVGRGVVSTSVSG